MQVEEEEEPQPIRTSRRQTNPVVRHDGTEVRSYATATNQIENQQVDAGNQVAAANQQVTAAGTNQANPIIMDDNEEEEILTAIKIPKLPKNAMSVELGLTKLKLQNVCARRGCLPAFSSAALPDLPADENAANDDDERKAVKMNRACMAILMESFQDNETAFAIAIDTIDKTAWLMGRAHKQRKK